MLYPAELRRQAFFGGFFRSPDLLPRFRRRRLIRNLRRRSLYPTELRRQFYILFLRGTLLLYTLFPIKETFFLIKMDFSLHPDDSPEPSAHFGFPVKVSLIDAQ